MVLEVKVLPENGLGGSKDIRFGWSWTLRDLVGVQIRLLGRFRAQAVSPPMDPPCDRPMDPIARVSGRFRSPIEQVSGF